MNMPDITKFEYLALFLISASLIVEFTLKRRQFHSAHNINFTLTLKTTKTKNRSWILNALIACVTVYFMTSNLVWQIIAITTIAIKQCITYKFDGSRTILGIKNNKILFFKLFRTTTKPIEQLSSISTFAFSENIKMKFKDKSSHIINITKLDKEDISNFLQIMVDTAPEEMQIDNSIMIQYKLNRRNKNRKTT